jgi:endonuclease-3
MEKNKKILEINKRLLERFGAPKKNGTPPEPVDLLIATILSQNTNDRNSYKAYQNLTKKFPDWEKAARARQSTIEDHIKVAGLGKQKSNSIKSFLTHLKKSKKKISLDYIKGMDNDSALEELVEYNGIGVKTASCVLLFSLERNVCPVDTHVHRTLNRLGVVNTKAPDKTYYAVNEDLPEGIAHSFHTNLIRLGREICKPKNPNCGLCPLNDICEFPDKNESNNKESKPNEFMLLDNISK